MMNPPFTTEDFLQVFEQYNLSVYPAQFFLYLMSFLSIFFLVKKHKLSNKIITVSLAFLWIWTGIIYHWVFFTAINQAAYVFGGLFVLQGILLLIFGWSEKLSFELQKNAVGYIGWFFIVYALFIYPILGDILGHTYPAKPTFGLPCSLVIFTFGVLLHTKKKVSGYLLLIPGLWAIIGFSAVILFGIIEDVMLIITAIVGTVLLIVKGRRHSPERK